MVILYLESLFNYGYLFTDNEMIPRSLLQYNDHEKETEKNEGCRLTNGVIHRKLH